MIETLNVIKLQTMDFVYFQYKKKHQKKFQIKQKHFFFFELKL